MPLVMLLVTAVTTVTKNSRYLLKILYTHREEERVSTKEERVPSKSGDSGDRVCLLS